MSQDAGVGGKKNISAIFTYKQGLSSIDMKTKVLRYVPRINVSTCHT